MNTPPAVEWPSIDEFEAIPDPPPFPSESLPLWLGGFVRAAAEAYQVPLDMAGMLGMAALSAASQGKMTVIANEGGWAEPVTLYIAAVMAPAERKSAIFDAINAPLKEWEAEIQDLEWPVVSASQQERAELESLIVSLDSKVTKASVEYMALRRNEMAAPDTVRAAEADLMILRENAIEARVRLAEHDTRYQMRLLFNDLTPEACAQHLARQRGERLAIISDEGGVFDVLTGARYNDKMNLDVFLKGHSGNLVQVDRIGRESERINRPMLTLGLAIQPSVLSDIGKSKQMHGRGLLARFLYSVPESAVGTRTVGATPVAAETLSLYHEQLKSVAGAMYAVSGVARVMLEDDAQELFYAYQRELEPRLKAEEGDLDEISEWAGKLAGAILRIAALIAMARERGVPESITLGDMEAALPFSDYLIAHAHRAFGLMGLSAVVTYEQKIVRRLQREGIEAFTTRDLMRKMHADRSYSADEFDQLLEGLARMGYLRKLIDNPKPFRYHWVVNPALHEEES